MSYLKRLCLMFYYELDLLKDDICTVPFKFFYWLSANNLKNLNNTSWTLLPKMFQVVNHVNHLIFKRCTKKVTEFS